MTPEHQKCTVDGCNGQVQKLGHLLCFTHWKLEKNKVSEHESSYLVTSQISKSKSDIEGKLNSAGLGEKYKLSSRQINSVLFELGWIERDGQGWKPTVIGEKLKAERKVFSINKVPYVLWHPMICKSRILQNAANEFLAIEVAQPAQVLASPLPEDAADKTEGFREKFPPTIRTSDGHMVRSRGEAIIDGMLYERRIVHAYERLVPVEQTLYCDFYLPEFDLYIEFWGMESNLKYKARKEKKLEIYRQNELRLIEIKDEHINNLEDYLMAQLVKYGYKAK